MSPLLILFTVPLTSSIFSSIFLTRLSAAERGGVELEARVQPESLTRESSTMDLSYKATWINPLEASLVKGFSFFGNLTLFLFPSDGERNRIFHWRKLENLGAPILGNCTSRCFHLKLVWIYLPLVHLLSF